MIKKFKHPPVVRAVSILILMLLWSFEIKAQSSFPTLTWDREVGCIDFDDRSIHTDFGIRADLFEAVNGSKCLRFCANSSVTYKLEANQVQRVKWQVEGGVLQSSTNSSARVLWKGAGNGALTVTITYTNGASSVYSFCIEKMVSPEALFRIDGPEEDQTQFCTGAPISFDNLSSHLNGSAIVNYLWDFGDGNSSNAFEPVHTYKLPGIYKVALTVTNSCNCSDVYAKVIEIIEVEPIEISCVSVTCEGNIETYSVNEGCGGDWLVEGGEIVAYNNNTIDVLWDRVKPEEGFGYVHYRSNCSCPVWNTVKVPVVLRRGSINGPSVVCQNKQGRFSLPQWPTTEFRWELNGNPNHPAIVLTDQHNEIVINGSALVPGNYDLTATYRNTLIDNMSCMGHASYRFRVTAAVDIVTDPILTLCQGTTKSFTTSTGGNINWVVTLNNSTIHSSMGNTLNYNFTKGGTYVVGSGSNYCIMEPVVINVIEKPLITTAVSGPRYVCLNTPYTYSMGESTPESTYVWSATGGTIIGNNTGTTVSMMFSSPVATISVVKQVVVDGVICKSDPITYEVKEITLDPIILNDSGVSDYCPSNVYSFSADLNGLQVDHMEWSIESMSGSSNFGNIIGGKYKPQVQVSFNEISSGGAVGVLTFSVTKCNVVTTRKKTINLLRMPVLNIGPIANVCPGASTITLNITSSPPVKGILKVGFGGAVPTGSYSFTSGVPLTVPNGFVNNTNGNITQAIAIKLEKPNGCNYTAVASRNATVFPATKIDISPGYYHVLCPSISAPIALSATISTGVTASVSFQWLKNGTVISGATTANYTVPRNDPEGNYQLRVRDKNGCTVTSDLVVVKIKCNPNPGCTISPKPNLKVTAKWETCTTIKAQVTYVGTPTSITWEGSSSVTPTGPNNSANGTFNVVTAGAHTVTAVLDYNGCMIYESAVVHKNYEPKLKTSISCNTNGTYNVTLLNNSNIYNIQPNAITYNYSGPGITGLVGGQEHTITNLAPGTYTYTLSLSSIGKPTCSIPITITLDPKPETEFTVAGPFCSDSAIALTVPGIYNPANRYEWHFGNTHYVASGPTTLINLKSGTQAWARLKVITPYGCVYQTVNWVLISVNQLSFDGTILPQMVNYCEGTPFVLNYNSVAGAVAPANAIWMRDNEEMGTGLSYTPTISGSYWPVLIGANGCKDYSMVAKTRNVVIRKPPFVSISGNTSVCAGQPVKLVGIVTESDVEHRWMGPSLPAAYSNWVTGNTNLSININNLPAGTYTYALLARSPSDPSCESRAEVVVVKHPVVAPPKITYALVNCSPYTLSLTAHGPNSGTYSWSNGTVGQNIQVTHGGAYRVTYTSTTGCTASESIQVPHNPERALWVVPTGCYDLCLNKGEYLLGPLGIYHGYSWNVDSSMLQSGNNTFVPNQHINAMGNHQLQIDYTACRFGSPIMNVTPAYQNCPQPTICYMEANIVPYDSIEGGEIYMVSVYNWFGSSVTMHLSSLNNAGTFSPTTVTVPPGYNTFLVSFYPNGTYPPGMPDVFVMQMAGCQQQVEVRLMSFFTDPSTVGVHSNRVLPELTLSPNPATETTVAHFDIGSRYIEAKQLVIYDFMGVQRGKYQLNGVRGELRINLGNLAVGTYLISLEADGKRIAEQKLIKNK